MAARNSFKYIDYWLEFVLFLWNSPTIFFLESEYLFEVPFDSMYFKETIGSNGDNICLTGDLFCCLCYQIFLGDGEQPEEKKNKGSPYFVQELSYLLAHVEEKIPFVQLGAEVFLYSS